MNSESPQRAPGRGFGLGDVTYALYGAALLLGTLDARLFAVLAVSALIIDYLKRETVSETLLETHLRWQIRTFWFTLLGVLAGSVLGAIGIGGIIDALLGQHFGASVPLVLTGWLLIAAASLWYVYRITKGWLLLREDEPVSMHGLL